MALCECGCGEDAGTYATTAKGHRKGEPRRYVNGHNWNGKSRRDRIAEGVHYRIEDRGYETPCWVWTRTRSRKGYGMVWDKTRVRLGQAHRVVYEQEVGPIPEGLQIDHLCRQRECVNPAHMEPVTGSENTRRGARARIPDETVERVRALREQGVSLNAIARATGISHPTVTAITRGTYWR